MKNNNDADLYKLLSNKHIEKQLLQFLQGKSISENSKAFFLYQNGNNSKNFLPYHHASVNKQLIIHNQYELRVYFADKMQGDYFCFFRRYGGKDKIKQPRLDIFFKKSKSDKRGGHAKVYFGVGTLVVNEELKNKKYNDINAFQYLTLKPKTQSGNNRIDKQFYVANSLLENATKNYQVDQCYVYKVKNDFDNIKREFISHEAQCESKSISLFPHLYAKQYGKAYRFQGLDGHDHIVMRKIGHSDLYQKLQQVYLGQYEYPTAERFSDAISLLNNYTKYFSDSLVHRDLKPGNVVISEKGLGLVPVDVGLVKKVGDKIKGAGTPGYTPSWLLMNETKVKVTKSCDYHMLAKIISEIFGSLMMDTVMNLTLLRYQQADFMKGDIVKKSFKAQQVLELKHNSCYGHPIFTGIYDIPVNIQEELSKVIHKMSSKKCTPENFKECIIQFQSLYQSWENKSQSNVKKLQDDFKNLSQEYQILSQIESTLDKYFCDDNSFQLSITNSQNNITPKNFLELAGKTLLKRAMVYSKLKDNDLRGIIESNCDEDLLSYFSDNDQQAFDYEKCLNKDNFQIILFESDISKRIDAEKSFFRDLTQLQQELHNVSKSLSNIFANDSISIDLENIDSSRDVFKLTFALIGGAIGSLMGLAVGIELKLDIFGIFITGIIGFIVGATATYGFTFFAEKATDSCRTQPEKLLIEQAYGTPSYGSTSFI